MIYNVENTAGTSGGSGGYREIEVGQAHNYLLSFQPGIYHITIMQIEADPRFVLFDPAGNIMTEVDNVEGKLDAAIWLSVESSGIYNLRVSANTPGRYNFSLSEGTMFADTVFTGEDNRITTDITQLNLGTLTGGTNIWVADPAEAVNLMLRSTGTEGSVVFRAEGQGAALPILVVIDPQGNIVGSDDNSDGDTVAEVAASLTLDGKYTIRVSVQQPSTESDKIAITAVSQ